MIGEAVSLPEGLLEAGLWFRVEAAATASSVRRSAERLAVELGMPERRVSDLAIVVAEAAGNLAKHADQGALLVRAVRTPEQAGVEIVAVDSGPGMADVAHSVGDGHSTTGTLGIGLGAIVRQAGWSDLYGNTLDCQWLDITDVQVLSLHHDISTVTGEEVVLFSLIQPPAFRETKRK